MNERELPDSEITRAIIGCAMRVHSALKNGFQEFIYQAALEIEMRDNSLLFSREHDMPIYFKGQLLGTRRVDFLVAGRIAVELKAIIQLEDVHIAQALNYLEAYNIQVGLLINFGSPSLQFHRLYNKKFKPNRTQVDLAHEFPSQKSDKSH
jgi:GxxExxY protein